jgi:hypothetical protein
MAYDDAEDANISQNPISICKIISFRPSFWWRAPESTRKQQLTLVACINILTSSSILDGDCSTACRSSRSARVITASSAISPLGQTSHHVYSRRKSYPIQSARQRHSPQPHSSRSTPSRRSPPSLSSTPSWSAAAWPGRHSLADTGPARAGAQSSPRSGQCRARILCRPYMLFRMLVSYQARNVSDW